MEPQETPAPVSSHIDIRFSVDEKDIARPVLKAGSYDCTVAFAREELSRQKQMPTLNVGWRLAQKAEDTRGREINPGFTLTQRILLVPSGKYTDEQRDQRLKEIQYATNGKSEFTGDTSVWIGKTARVKVIVREPHTDEVTGQEFGESNEIRQISAAK